MKKPYDLIHLFFVNSPVYNYATQVMLTKYTSNYKQLFVYQYSKHAVITESSICDSSLSNVASLEKYFEIGEFIVIHGLHYSTKEISEIPQQIARHLIWCIWGHDLYNCQTNMGALKGSIALAKKTLRPLIKHRSWKQMNQENQRYVNRIREFAGIFVGFPQDEIAIRKKFGDEIKVFCAQYPIGPCADVLLSAPKDKLSIKKNLAKVRVLVGHSSAQYLNHGKILKKLRKYRGEVEVHIPLSYGCGGKEYAHKVEKYAKKLFGRDAYIYSDFIANEEYIKLLRNIDVAVFDHKQQAALGNIFLLLFLGKKVYLNKRGVVSKGLRRSNLIVFDTQTLGRDSLENFKTVVLDEKNRSYAKNRIDPQELVKDWCAAFEEIMSHGKEP